MRNSYQLRCVLVPLETHTIEPWNITDMHLLRTLENKLDTFNRLKTTATHEWTKLNKLTFPRAQVRLVRWDLWDTSRHSARVCVSLPNMPSPHETTPDTGRWQMPCPACQWCLIRLGRQQEFHTLVAPWTCTRCRIFTAQQTRMTYCAMYQPCVYFIIV